MDWLNLNHFLHSICPFYVFFVIFISILWLWSYPSVVYHAQAAIKNNTAQKAVIGYSSNNTNSYLKTRSIDTIGSSSLNFIATSPCQWAELHKVSPYILNSSEQMLLSVFYDITPPQ